MNSRENIFEKLKDLEIAYELVEHAPAFTMDEYNALGFNPNDEICKNLFLRDYKGTRHMLVVLKGSKHADLGLIRDEVDSSKLSFASDERLAKYLDVKKGSVSPLGLINDETGAVEVYFDEDLKDAARLGFHPNDNTATVFLPFRDIQKYIVSTGHTVHFIKV
ncbi:MAG: prolyl-tRNA synthetase associated domain-containing protein [Candidatus Fimenecus sp.]